MARALLVCLAIALLAEVPVYAADRPTYELGRDGVLVVGALPSILSRAEVKPHLMTGLTTSLVVAVTANGPEGRKARGAARIDVRWEPWDEVFVVSVLTADRRPRRETLPSLERLIAWWRALELPVATAVPADRWQVKVELSVVPFSQSEQRDAQRWFANAPGNESPQGRSAVEGESRLDDVVDLFIATSIQRRSLVRYAWVAQRREGARGGA